MRRRDVSTTGTCVGLDLSLTASAACAVPLNWNHDLALVKTYIVGRKLTLEATPQDALDRMLEIADGIFEFCRTVQARHVWIEQHAFGAQGRNANQTIEMTGIVKAKLYEDWGIVVVPIVASSARKILLQRLPRKDVKKFAVRNIKRLGGQAATWTDDQCDAFCVVNAALMKIGGTAMTFLGE